MIRLGKPEDAERVNALRRQVNDLHVQGRPDLFKPGFGPELQAHVMPYLNGENGYAAVEERDGRIGISMKEKQGWLIRRAEIDRFSGSILKGNRTAVRLMATTGTVLSAVNLVVQMVVSHFDMPVFRSALLLAYFTLLLFIDRVILPKDKPIPTGVLYIIQGPIMLISLLLGTVWDPDNIATTFLLFMTATAWSSM